MGDHHLTVVRDFGDYVRGNHIEDDAEIERILGGELRHHVVKVAADVKPAEETPDAIAPVPTGSRKVQQPKDSA